MVSAFKVRSPTGYAVLVGLFYVVAVGVALALTSSVDVERSVLLGVVVGAAFLVLHEACDKADEVHAGRGATTTGPGAYLGAGVLATIGLSVLGVAAYLLAESEEHGNEAFAAVCAAFLGFAYARVMKAGRPRRTSDASPASPPGSTPEETPE